MKKLVTITGLAVVAVTVAACGSSATSAPPAATTSAATAASQPTAATSAPTPTSAATGTATPAATSSGAAGESPSVSTTTVTNGWCGVVTSPVTYSTLSSWLNGAGYSTVQMIEGTLTNLKVPNVPAATVQQDGSVLCTEVADAESALPPADQSDFNTAMADLMKASSYLHVATAAAQAEAAPDIAAGTTALDNFLKAVGKPVQ